MALLVLLANLALLFWGSSRPPSSQVALEPPPLPEGLPRLLLLEESERRIPIPPPATADEGPPPCLRLNVTDDRDAAEALALDVAALGHDVIWLELHDGRTSLEIRPGTAGVAGFSEDGLMAMAREAGLALSGCLEEPPEPAIAPPTTIP